MKSVCMETSLGRIVFTLRSDVAPKTSAHFTNLIDAKLYDDVTFYRSDFVIQGGLHGKKGVKNPFPDLNVNEASREDALSNRRGTLSVGHWDVPDCGNSEFFINLKDNPHLDKAYGGYVVWAQVKDEDSLKVVDKIASVIASGDGEGKKGNLVRILSVRFVVD
jgi:cyclophilin family peptidyl-prolyl cis-trans isomerase